jgi:hypothetical protein
MVALMVGDKHLPDAIKLGGHNRFALDALPNDVLGHAEAIALLRRSTDPSPAGR